MTITDFVRIAIWLTFFALIAGEVTAIIWARRFSANYVRKHRALEVQVNALERRLQSLERSAAQ